MNWKNGVLFHVLSAVSSSGSTFQITRYFPIWSWQSYRNRRICAVYHWPCSCRIKIYFKNPQTKKETKALGCLNRTARTQGNLEMVPAIQGTYNILKLHGLWSCEAVRVCSGEYVCVLGRKGRLLPVLFCEISSSSSADLLKLAVRNGYFSL